MIEKRATLDSVQFLPDGLAVRFKKQTVSDGQVIAEEWHRSTFQPGGDVEAWLTTVETDLANKGYAGLSAVDRNRLKSLTGPKRPAFSRSRRRPK